MRAAESARHCPGGVGEKTLADRGLDFEDALEVFQGLTVELEEVRKDYGERRILCFGLLAGRMVVVGYTPRGAVRHIFSMRKANDREQTRLAPYFGL
ncbi:BrnT family toxin [Hylemonella gracilis]|uniref:BrnT family toxin n=1 Tax=Hylemonella gracilis TaxID=80880 RepID=UPI0003032122|nr:BrnT family toxin [Hylemonella gracilis]